MDFSKIKSFLCSFLKWSALQFILLIVVFFITLFVGTEIEKLFNSGWEEYCRSMIHLHYTNENIHTLLNKILIQIFMVIPCTLFFCIGKFYFECKHKTIIAYISYMIFSTILNYFCSVKEYWEDAFGEYHHWVHYISWDYLIPTLLYPLIIGVLQLIILKLKKEKTRFKTEEM